jgi:hypothetical protein
MFIHRPHHLRALWWKLNPPPIPSPYLHNPKFATQLENFLSSYAARAYHPVEFGCLYGWTTNIIARNLPPNITLYVYDTFEQASMDQVGYNLRNTWCKVEFHRFNIWHWLAGLKTIVDFDFMYVDVNNTELIFKEVWTKARPQISRGATVLIEGATRMRLNIPHMKIITTEPGLGLLLP